MRELPYHRRRIGIIFQDFLLLTQKTAFQNVAYALQIRGASTKQINSLVPEVLDWVGISKKARSYPHELSGGEQQRVAIARAVVTDPTILVADEPTGDLDRVSAEEVLNLMERLNRESGKTIIMVTHDPRAAKRAVVTRHLDKGFLNDVHPQTPV